MSFQEVVHSDRTEETGATKLQKSLEGPNEYRQECRLTLRHREAPAPLCLCSTRDVKKPVVTMLRGWRRIWVREAPRGKTVELPYWLRFRRPLCPTTVRLWRVHCRDLSWAGASCTSYRHKRTDGSCRTRHCSSASRASAHRRNLGRHRQISIGGRPLKGATKSDCHPVASLHRMDGQLYSLSNSPPCPRLMLVMARSAPVNRQSSIFCAYFRRTGAKTGSSARFLVSWGSASMSNSSGGSAAK